MKKGFYQPILFIIVMTIIVSYFGYLHFLYLDKVESAFKVFQEVEKRVVERSRIDLEVIEASGDVVSAGYDTSSGFSLKNQGTVNSHRLSVYWVSPSTASGFCRIPFTSGDTELLELSRNASESLDTSGCFDTIVNSGDYFVIHSYEKSVQRFV